MNSAPILTLHHSGPSSMSWTSPVMQQKLLDHMVKSEQRVLSKKSTIGENVARVLKRSCAVKKRTELKDVIVDRLEV